MEVSSPNSYLLKESNEDAIIEKTWKRCALEVFKIIADPQRTKDGADSNKLLLENKQLKQQYDMAIGALDSIITEEDKTQIKSLNCTQEKKGDSQDNSKQFSNKEAKMFPLMEKKSNINRAIQVNFVNEKENSLSINNSPHLQQCKNTLNFKEIQMKFNKNTHDEQKGHKLSKKDTPKDVEFLCCKCLQVEKFPGLNPVLTVSDTNKNLDTQTVLPNTNNLKIELQQALQSNRILKEEITNLKVKNEALHDQVQSLELSLKTVTEAINLQDEQLSDYASVVTSLKKSRSLLVDKLKEANSRNSYNIMIMSNIEEEIEHLRRQLDVYNELLTNQNVQQTDKASATEGPPAVHDSVDEMKKKDNYITVLQDRLCEAIIDLRNKDSEIKNQAKSVKSLINNYEAEKACLEERLNLASTSAKKLEEHKIKQQETMKQLMKLIEFLQGKLEKINKK